MQPKLIVVFALSLFCAIAGPYFLPSIRLLAFAPFLTILFTRCNLITCLWCAFGCGLIMDLLSSQMQLGIHALNYILITLALFRLRRRLVAHKPIALAILSSIFSLLSTTVQLLIMKIYGIAPPMNTLAYLSDLIVMPLFDGIYAFIGYTCPIIAYRFCRKTFKRLNASV